MKLAAIGSNCIDHYTNTDDVINCPGGGPVNMAVYTIRNGGQASYIGLIGDDLNGKIMYDALKDKGVDVSHLRVEKGKTAVTEVELINGERVFGVYDEGVLSGYKLLDEDIDFVCSHDIVICDLWGKVERQFKDLKRRGVLTAFDCADRPEDDRAQTAMPYCDYLFFSSDDKDDEVIRKQLKDYQSKGPKLVVAMRGEEGSLCYDGEQYYGYGIIECDVVDTLGAGDSYIAGFLGGIVDGLCIEECMKKGAQTASETIGYFVAW